VTNTEAVLDSQRLEQESITEDLSQMPKRLKESSVTFCASLESEKAYLEAAREGLPRPNGGEEYGWSAQESSGLKFNFITMHVSTVSMSPLEK
jgi:hypothetical protein